MLEERGEYSGGGWHCIVAMAAPTADFDLSFIVGTTILAMVTGFAVASFPSLFLPVLLIDLWLFGYHHVISTYTRLCFDRRSFLASRALIFGLLPLVALSTILVALTVGSGQS